MSAGVARVPVGADGTAWFKANPPGSAFEPGLLGALSRLAPHMVPPPLAVDTRRAWMLSMDAGSRLGELLRRDADPAHLTVLLRRYAHLQLELAARPEELLALGLPDLRPAVLPERLAALLDDPAVRAALRPGQVRALRDFAPVLARRCRQLEGFGFAASLDHGDLHPNNVFGCADGALAFDWGDASLTHPFSSLLVLLRAGGRFFGAEGLAALRSAYLEPWLEAGYGPGEVRRAADLAVRLAPVARAMAWGRVFACFTDADEPNANQARRLLHLLAAGPLDEVPEQAYRAEA
ncbi:phosphotransferase [Actinocrinis puniceicyclus]|uniref:Phosphotransferase n=1 Tax=Actinocrinis puniceicyclus TaxID=977794 RepID=A0A8J8BEN8_9ACTN|nr:phosphotransferase [Actinocrinis puniceicyclus]MBS2965755.1 phosphotransferase [Actinocrinis puniceicyclus]